jgi:glycosyltransferase involved in cell wall biosynthesis
MRIGIDAREAFRPEPRGIGLYTRHLVHALAELAPGDEFVLYHQRPKPADLELRPPLVARHADLPGSRLHSWERVLIPWRIRRDRLDVWHGTYNTLPPRLRLWQGPPMVVTLHDVIVTWWPDDLDDPYVRYVRRVTPRVVRDAAVILTVSEFSKRDICNRFDCDPAKIRVVHNGLAPAIERGAPPGAGDAARERLADGRPYLFAIGAALERKNTGRLIEAFGRARAARPDLPHLLLVSGVQKQADRFAAIAAQAGATDHVRFLPYQSAADLVALYAGAALTIYPSRIEGWGLPVTESLALGTPVLTSNTSSMPEAGGSFAHYFDPEDVESMAHELLAAIERYVPTFGERRAAAVLHARSWTWRDAAAAVLQAYRDAAARG